MKCVILGDEGVGKSSLALTFLLGRCPDFIDGDTFSSYTKYFNGVKVEVIVTCKMNFGNPDMCRDFFKDIDAVLLCFAVDAPSTFESVQQSWFHIVREHAAHAQLFLVGCKLDTLPYRELSAGTVLLTPSLLLRSPTITSIKNAINGSVPRSESPLLSNPPSREVTETNLRDLVPSREHTSLSGEAAHPRGEHVITRDLGKNLASQLGCAEYIECSVKEELNGPHLVNSLFSKVVNKTVVSHTSSAKTANRSRACVIL